MTPELRKLRLALMIFAGAWFMQALLAQVMLYNHARQTEALQVRLQQFEATIEGIRK
jgi:hypothetical protein